LRCRAILFSMLLLTVSLAGTVKAAPDDASKLEALFARARNFIYASHDSLQYYIHRLLTVGNASGEPTLQSDAYYKAGYLYSRAALLDSALIYLNQSLSLYRQLSDSTGIGMAKNQIGHIYWLKNKQAAAKTFFEDAIRIHRRHGNPRELGKALTNLANLYTRWGEYKESINLFMEALENYRKSDFTEGVAWLEFSLSLLYKRVAEYQKARDYLLSALDTYSQMAAENNDSTGVRLCYNQLGFLYTHHLDSLSKGLGYQLDALRLAQKSGVKTVIADGLTGVGQTYYKMQAYEQARQYLQQAYELRVESGIMTGRASNLKFLGYIAADQGQFAKARDYYHQALREARELNYRNIRSDVLRALSALYEQQQDYQTALDYYQQHISLRDSILSNEVSKKVASTQLQYEIEKKDQENKQLAQQNRIQQLKLARTQLLRNLLIGGLVLALLIILLVLFLYRKQRQIKTLRGLIPICSHCKKIRNDKGYYEHLEQYIAEHSDAVFSHGLCPECLQKYYPEYSHNLPKKKQSRPDRAVRDSVKS